MQLRHASSLTVAAIVLVLAWPAALGGATSYVVVSGVSMEPMLESGDLAVVRRATSYEVGDVIAFATEDGDVIHRIVGGSATDGFVTQGDNVDRVDPYRPRTSDIRGREVLHLPAVGALGLRLVRIVPAPLLAALAILLALGGSEQRRRRRRPRRATPVQSPPAPRPNGEAPMSQSPFQRPRIQLAAACAVAALVVVPSVVVAWRVPSTAEVPATEAPVRHTISVDVVGLADEPSDLYPEGRSRTITAGPDGTLPEDSPTLLRGLLDRVEVTVTHDTLGVADATGAGRVDVAVVTGTNFELPLPGVPTTSYADGTFRATATIDLDEADQRFADYLAASGLERDTMSIRVTPVVVTADGTTVLGGPVELRPNGQVIAVDGTLRTVVTPDGETTVVTRTAALVGVPLPVPVVRWLGLAIVMGLLAVAAVALRRELDERPHVRIGLLHGSLLVDVAPETTVGGEVVRVVSISELARLARRDQRPILHQERGDGSHHYLVPDGELTYEYVVDGPHGPADDEHVPTGEDEAPAVVDLDDLAAVATEDGGVADEPPTTPEDLPQARAVLVEDFAALTRIWMRDNPAPGRMQRRRMPDGRTRFSVVRNGRAYVYETQPTERVASTRER